MALRITQKHTYGLTNRIIRGGLGISYGEQKCKSFSCVSTLVIFGFRGASLIGAYHN